MQLLVSKYDVHPITPASRFFNTLQVATMLPNLRRSCLGAALVLNVWGHVSLLASGNGSVFLFTFNIKNIIFASFSLHFLCCSTSM